MTVLYRSGSCPCGSPARRLHSSRVSMCLTRLTCSLRLSVSVRESSCSFFFFSSRRRHTRLVSDWSSDVCSSDLTSYANANADHAGVAASGRLRTDALGTIQAPTLAVVSTSNYNAQSGGTQRWGDYSAVMVDPTDDQTMWAFGEYCNSSNSWGVRAIQLLAPPPATPTSANPSTRSEEHTSGL